MRVARLYHASLCWPQVLGPHHHRAGFSWFVHLLHNSQAQEEATVARCDMSHEPLGTEDAPRSEERKAWRVPAGQVAAGPGAGVAGAGAVPAGVASQGATGDWGCAERLGTGLLGSVKEHQQPARSPCVPGGSAWSPRWTSCAITQAKSRGIGSF
jgi:hypothetical protein